MTIYVEKSNVFTGTFDDLDFFIKIADFLKEVAKSQKKFSTFLGKFYIFLKKMVPIYTGKFNDFYRKM